MNTEIQTADGCRERVRRRITEAVEYCLITAAAGATPSAPTAAGAVKAIQPPVGADQPPRRGGNHTSVRLRLLRWIKRWARGQVLPRLHLTTYGAYQVLERHNRRLVTQCDELTATIQRMTADLQQLAAKVAEAELAAGAAKSIADQAAPESPGMPTAAPFPSGLPLSGSSVSRQIQTLLVVTEARLWDLGPEEELANNLTAVLRTIGYTAETVLLPPPPVHDALLFYTGLRLLDLTSFNGRPVDCLITLSPLAHVLDHMYKVCWVLEIPAQATEDSSLWVHGLASAARVIVGSAAVGQTLQTNYGIASWTVVTPPVGPETESDDLAASSAFAQVVEALLA